MTKSLEALLAVARERISGANPAGRNTGEAGPLKLGDKPGVDYAPKSEGDRKFVGDHAVIKQEYPNGMEHAFTGDKVGYSMDKPQMKRFGNKEAEAVKANEEVEPIDELEKKTLKSYVKKAKTSEYRLGKKGESEEDKSMSTDGNKYPEKQARHQKAATKLYHKQTNRWKGIDRAEKKLKEEVELEEGDRSGQRVRIHGGMKEFHGKTGIISRKESGQYRVRLDTPVHVQGVGHVKDDLWDSHHLKKIKEEAEPIDELSKEKLTQYVDKAKKDRAKYNFYTKTGYEKARTNKRSKGINKANEKLAKEEVEPVDEVSKGLLKRYRKAALKDYRTHDKAINKSLKKGEPASEREPHYNTQAKRVDGGRRAEDKIEGRKKYIKVKATEAIDKVTKDGAESISEISKGMAARYIVQAHNKGSLARSRADQAFRDGNIGKQVKNDKKDDKRAAGISIAAAKLSGTAKVNAKEELTQEQIDAVIEAAVLCDKGSLGKKMKYHKGKMKSEEIGSTKFKHHQRQVHAIKGMMEDTDIDESRGGPNDPRKEKRAFRKMGMDNKVQDAYYRGEHDASKSKDKKNPYPKGKRHDEYNRGKKPNNEELETIDEISGKTLGSYIQKARGDAEKKRAHNQALNNDPSVKKHAEKRSEYYQRRDYTASGESKHRDKIANTHKRESEAKAKLDPDHKKNTNYGKRFKGIEKAVKKLQHGKLTDEFIDPTVARIKAFMDKEPK